ncbi:MAG: hypothetical protein HUJ76_05945 [Parasporobacterium sp.]|nr:hypothetical protein [Parasporobacterium sp.]
MRKRIVSVLAVTLGSVMVLAGSASALGTYDYDALGKNSGIFINGDEIIIDEGNVTVNGEVSSSNGIITINGVMMEYSEIGDWTAGSASASVDMSGDSSGESSGTEAADGEGDSSGESSAEAAGDSDGTAAEDSDGASDGGSAAAADENAEPAQAGQTGIVVRGDVETAQVNIGGAEDVFTAPDGKQYNSVIILRADDADTENALKPGTTRSLLDNDVETYPGVGLAVTGDKVTLDNVYILTDGANRSAFLNSETMGQYVDTVIKDSTFVTLSDGWIFPSFKCIYRAARTALCTSYGSTWMYNTRMYSDSWGNYSMEGANGIEHYYVINGYSESNVGGYGLFTLGMGEDYVQGNNYVRVYGSKMISPQYGWICDDGPNVIIGSMADMASDEHAMDNYDGEITEDMYVSEGGRSFFGGAVNAAVLCFDMAAYTDLAADITIKNSVFTTVGEELIHEDGTPVGNLLDLDPSILHNDTISAGMEYFGLAYVNGSVFWLRGANSDLKLENVEMRSENNVLMHSTVDYSNWDGSNLAGQAAVGYKVAMKDMDVEGDIIHDDYQRKMFITLDGTTLDGAMNYYTCEEYAARAAAFIDSEWEAAEASKAAWEAENGADSSLMGTKEDILGWLVYDESYDGSLTGLELTLENGAVWNVTGESHLSSLTVGEGCTVNGIITENADGTFTVSPAAAE